MNPLTHSSSAPPRTRRLRLPISAGARRASKAGARVALLSTQYKGSYESGAGEEACLWCALLDSAPEFPQIRPQLRHSISPRTPCAGITCGRDEVLWGRWEIAPQSKAFIFGRYQPLILSAPPAPTPPKAQRRLLPPRDRRLPRRPRRRQAAAAERRASPPEQRKRERRRFGGSNAGDCGRVSGDRVRAPAVRWVPRGGLGGAGCVALFCCCACCAFSFLPSILSRRNCSWALLSDERVCGNCCHF